MIDIYQDQNLMKELATTDKIVKRSAIASPSHPLLHLSFFSSPFTSPSSLLHLFCACRCRHCARCHDAKTAAKHSCHLVVDCPHLRQLDVVCGHRLLEQARVQLPPHVREPDVVGGSGEETINIHYNVEKINTRVPQCANDKQYSL